MKRIVALACLCCLSAFADVSIHIDSVTPNFAYTGPSNSIPLTKAEITITGLTVGQSFVPQKCYDFTNWVGDIGQVIATNSTFHYQSVNSGNIYINQVFYRVFLP